MRLQSSASDIWSDHQRLIDFLELLAGNEPQNIGQHDEGNDKSENQTPRRHMRADVQQERRIGPRNRNRTIHIVNGESGHWQAPIFRLRSEEHTSELQSLMRISYDVFCLNNKK